MERPASGESGPRRREKLPRRSILRKRSVIQELRASGKKRSNHLCALLSKSCRADEETQAAFLTPKRIGAATVRNRVRRRMREIYRRYIAAGMDHRFLVWSARPDAAQVGFEELKSAMLQLCDGQKINRREP